MEQNLIEQLKNLGTTQFTNEHGITFTTDCWGIDFRVTFTQEMLHRPLLQTNELTFTLLPLPAQYYQDLKTMTIDDAWTLSCHLVHLERDGEFYTSIEKIDRSINDILSFCEKEMHLMNKLTFGTKC
jgi:hypothetical protein